MSYSQDSTYTAFPFAKQEGSIYRAPALKGEDGEVIGYTVQTINSAPETLYALWSDVESIPRWQEHVVSVVRTGERTSRWVMGDPEDPDGKRVEFDSEITESVPGSRIAWRSLTEGVEQSGVVIFEKTISSRGTRVTLHQMAKVPGGSLGNAVAAVVKRSPRKTVIEDLRHFKEMAETGEIPTVAGQPHGERGVSGAIKGWMYGETNPTPPGSSEA
ncbi:MAG: SRPBCC family protein [Janthinobacterium lividum]